MPDAGNPAENSAATPAATPAPTPTPAPDQGPAAPAPLGVARTPTGDAGIDGLLQRLADADHLPAEGHLEVYEDVHRGLRDALTALDARPPSSSYDHRS